MPPSVVQVAEPWGPEFAVTVRVAPGASDAVLVSDQVTRLPSISKRTPMMVPAGVATVPSFLTVAEKVTGVPGLGLNGVERMLLTVRSMPTASGAVSLLLFSFVSAKRLTSSTQASIVCRPEPALQVELPDGPLLAVTVML